MKLNFSLKTIFLLTLLSPAFACQVTPELLDLTSSAAQRHGVEPELLAALVWQESRFCQEALSPKGAIGLAQLMPGTARGLGVDPYDAAENLEGGAMYLRKQFDTFGTWPLALAAYNAGPQAVIRHSGVPPFEETQAYVPAVLARYAELKLAEPDAVVVAEDPPEPINTITSIAVFPQHRRRAVISSP